MSSKDVCQRIAAELLAIAQAWCRGAISEAEFVDAVLDMEMGDIRRNGMTLTACNTIDDWTAFHLRKDGARECIVSFEFLPTRGLFRQSSNRSVYDFPDFPDLATGT